ncbi:hypothetical protein [Anatilimnocola aggregata]|uniref:hypothetical protein n=1 Tax=Anatilimnocola aggregata TaxID=2528021 RepID=UPI0011A7452B|nr:hypothetical protein [Anatilimnocola aggregata]
MASLFREMQEKSLLHRQQEKAAKGVTTSQLPSRTVLIAGAVLGCLLLVMFSRWLLVGTSPKSLAAQMTAHCLAGDWELAEALVGEDEYELGDFQKWRITHFASIQQKFRPNDTTNVQVEVIEADSDQLVANVIISSRILGTRKIMQYWTREEEGWLFDATASLRDPRKLSQVKPKPTAAPRKS